MSRIDLHVKVLDFGVIDRAKRCGLDAIVYAPHFTRLPDIESVAARFSDDELRVIPARELFTGPWWNRRHILALGLSDPIPDFLSLEATVTELERQDATILAPHPTFFSVSLTEAELGRYREQLHAIETYNPKFLPVHTRRARRLASELAIPSFGSSYAHLRRSVGEVWTTFNRRIDSSESLERAIRNGDIQGVDHRDGIGHLLHRALEFSHLGWENSYQKANRVLLSDIEPTHPQNPAYPERFRAASVY